MKRSAISLNQPCSTSGQLAECGQKGHVVRPNEPLQKKWRHTLLYCQQNKEISTTWTRAYVLYTIPKFQLQHLLSEIPVLIWLQWWMGILITCKMHKCDNLQCMAKFGCYVVSKQTLILIWGRRSTSSLEYTTNKVTKI